MCDEMAGAQSGSVVCVLGMCVCPKIYASVCVCANVRACTCEGHSGRCRTFSYTFVPQPP